MMTLNNCTLHERAMAGFMRFALLADEKRLQDVLLPILKEAREIQAALMAQEQKRQESHHE